MNKSVKVALKRFLVLFICLLMVVPLLAVDGVSKNAKIIVGSCVLGVVVIYWIYAFIAIRRDNQRKKRNENEK